MNMNALVNVNVNAIVCVCVCVNTNKAAYLSWITQRAVLHAYCIGISAFSVGVRVDCIVGIS